ncbi:MAG TPA: hypothetical protein VH912_29170 [Streptosporangiaceae bacterium]
MDSQQAMGPGELAGTDDILTGLRAADQRRRARLAEQSPAGQVDLHEFAERGRSRALAVVVARLIAVALPGRVRPVTAALSVAVMGTWPLLIALIAAAGPVANPLRGTTGLLFSLATSVICVVMLASGWTAWRWTTQLAESFSELLATSPDRGSFVAWLTGRFHLLGQFVSCAVGAALAVGMVYAVSHQQTDSVSASVWIYLIAAWTGVIGGDVVYWLYTLAEIPPRLHRCNDLQMAWIDPAHTPAVVQLCRVYTRVAAATGLGVILIELCLLAVTSDHPGQLMKIFVVGFPVFAVATALYVGVQPYITLSHLVRHHIDHIIDPLMAQMAHPPGELLLHNDLDGAFRAYSHFRTLRRLPVKTTSVVQYVTGILASLIVYLIQQWASFGPKK